MSDSPFLRFIELVNIDRKIHSLVQRQTSLDKSLDVNNKQRTDYALLIEELSKKVLQLKKNVDLQELEMKVLDEREREKKKMIDNLSDYKEYQAIKNEIEAIQRLQINHEKIVLEAWNQVEAAQELLKKKEQESIADMQKLDDDVAKLVQEKTFIDGELSDLRMQRDTHLVNIPKEWLEKYNIMGQRVDNPVVPIEQNSCSGCYQQLIAQDLVRARHGALLQCKKCFRLLYLPDGMK